MPPNAPNITYKTLYQYVTDEIERRLPKDNTTASTQAAANVNLASGGANSNNNEIINGIGNFMAEAIAPRISWGLGVTATDPESKTVKVAAGKGIVNGEIKSLLNDIELIVPFDENTPIFYINLYRDKFQ